MAELSRIMFFVSRPTLGGSTRGGGPSSSVYLGIRDLVDSELLRFDC